MKNNDVSLEQVLEDTERQIKRLNGAKAIDARSELINNVYPLLRDLAVAAAVNFEALDEFLAEDEGGVDDEFLKVVAGNVSIGLALAEELSKTNTDKDVALAINVYKESATKIQEMITDLESDEDDEDDEDEDDDE